MTRRGGGLDWRRVAGVLGTKDPEDVIGCRHCRARGSIPYIAEHVLTAHRESREGRLLAKIVAGEDAPPPKPAAGEQPADAPTAGDEPPASEAL